MTHTATPAHPTTAPSSGRAPTRTDPVAVAVLAGLVLLLAYGVPAFVLGGAGIGMGDAKLAPSLGLALGWLSWGHVLRGTLYAFLLGGLVAIVLVATRRVGRKDPIPFGPFLLVGAWSAILLT